MFWSQLNVYLTISSLAFFLGFTGPGRKLRASKSSLKCYEFISSARVLKEDLEIIKVRHDLMRKILWIYCDSRVLQQLWHITVQVMLFSILFSYGFPLSSNFYKLTDVDQKQKTFVTYSYNRSASLGTWYSELWMTTQNDRKRQYKVGRKLFMVLGLYVFLWFHWDWVTMVRINCRIPVNLSRWSSQTWAPCYWASKKCEINLSPMLQINPHYVKIIIQNWIRGESLWRRFRCFLSQLCQI